MKIILKYKFIFPFLYIVSLALPYTLQANIESYKVEMISGYQYALGQWLIFSALAVFYLLIYLPVKSRELRLLAWFSFTLLLIYNYALPFVSVWKDNGILVMAEWLGQLVQSQGIGYYISMLLGIITIILIFPVRVGNKCAESPNQISRV